MKIDKYYKYGLFNKFWLNLSKLLKTRIPPEPLPSAIQVDLYYRGLPDDITEAEYDRIIAQENDYFDEN